MILSCRAPERAAAQVSDMSMGEIHKWRTHLVSLMSLLHGVALAELGYSKWAVFTRIVFRRIRCMMHDRMANCTCTRHMHASSVVGIHSISSLRWAE